MFGQCMDKNFSHTVCGMAYSVAAALSLLLLLRLSGIGLPPLLQSWQAVSAELLDELHQAHLSIVGHSSMLTCWLCSKPEQTDRDFLFLDTQVLVVPRGLDAALDLVRELLQRDDRYAWGNLERGFPVLVDMLARHNRRFPSPPASVAAAAHVLHRRHVLYRDCDRRIAAQVDALLAAVASNPSLLPRDPCWNEILVMIF